jgi:hypothetical protein
MRTGTCQTSPVEINFFHKDKKKKKEKKEKFTFFFAYRAHNPTTVVCSKRLLANMFQDPRAI